LIRLSYVDINKKIVKDTALLKNGKFIFKGAISGPVSSIISGNTKSQSSDDPNFLELFLTPGKMTIRLRENNFKQAKVTGSAMQEDMVAVNKLKEYNSKEEKNLSLQIEQIDKNGHDIKDSKASALMRDSLYKIYLQYRKEDEKVDCLFIKTHPGSYLSPYLMDYDFGSRKMTLDSALLFYNKFTASVKNSPAGKSIYEKITARMASSVGNFAPTFTKVDINGQTFDLTAFRDKSYILLDFWASWCKPCREETPQLKKLYKQYHAKGLEVVSISWDSKEKNWKDAIAQDTIAMWRHIMADMYLPNDNSLRNTYAIEGIPTFILIDKRGRIIGRYRGGDDEGNIEDLDKKLAEVMPGR